jgi:hypothetical protein
MVSYRRGLNTGVVGGLAALILIGGAATCNLIPHAVRNEYTATLTEKVIKRYDDKDVYLLFTELEDGSVRVFRNEDSGFIERKWNSSDVQAALKEGATYEFEVYGWRFPPFSWYENVVGYEMIRSSEENAAREHSLKDF